MVVTDHPKLEQRPGKVSLMSFMIRYLVGSLLFPSQAFCRLVQSSPHLLSFYCMLSSEWGSGTLPKKKKNRTQPLLSGALQHRLNASVCCHSLKEQVWKLNLQTRLALWGQYFPKQQGHSVKPMLASSLVCFLALIFCYCLIVRMRRRPFPVYSFLCLGTFEGMKDS